MAAVLTHLFPTGRLMGHHPQPKKNTSARQSNTKQEKLEPRDGSDSLSKDDENEESLSEEEAEKATVPGPPAQGEQDEEYQDSESDNPGNKSHAKRSDLNARRRSRRRHDQESSLQEGESNADKELTESNANSSEVDAQWDAGSEDGEEADIERPSSNKCLYCGEDEENDPSDEFEEYLACAGCGESSHQHCARLNHSLFPEEDPKSWRCPNCLENGVEPDQDSESRQSQRQSSAPRFARDLLPTQSGSSRPGSHSVFNALILDDDPMDGSRSLRKRKASDTEATEDVSSELRKHPRRMTSDARPGRISTPPVSQGLHQPHTTVATVGHNHQANGGLLDASPRARSTRTRALRLLERKTSLEICHVPERPKGLVAIFHCSPEKLINLDTEKRRRHRREKERVRRTHLNARTSGSHHNFEVSHYPALPPSSFALQAFAFQEKEGDELKTRPYGGILTEAEGDTSKTFPQPIDRRKFEDARQKAEDDWRKQLEASAAPEPGRSTHMAQKTANPPSKIKCINFAGYEVDTWHAAPYPEEYNRNKTLYICEFCLKYMNSDFVAWRHKLKCPAKHPPGDEVYRDGSLSFFEVDGRKNPVYCQNLCLLAKLFLGSKTLYYDVEPFLFYVMTENDEFGCHFVGYFSKEKRPSSLNNVSCILVLPIHQRRGFGHLLIDFSYLLTRVEEKTGSPEKPLSDMGLVSYRSYWRLLMCYRLLDEKAPISIDDISQRTGMTADDIVCALEGLRALVRDPITKTYALRLDHAFFREYIRTHEAKGYAKLNPDALIWVPYVMGRDNSHYENAAPLHTVAQRDEDERPAPPEEGVQQQAADEEAELDDDIELPGVGKKIATNIRSPSRNETIDQQPNDATTPSSVQDMGKAATLDSRRDEASTKQSSSNSLVDEQVYTASPIPASRFEVFPPLPGTRKPGRPSKRGSSRRGTPVTRALSFGEKPIPGQSTSTVRRTRSKLGEGISSADIAGDGPTSPIQGVDSFDAPETGHGAENQIRDKSTP